MSEELHIEAHPSVVDAISWLLDTIDRTKYGTVTLSVVMHHREVARINRATEISVLPRRGAEK